MTQTTVKVASLGVAAVLSLCAFSNMSKALAQEKGDAYDAFNRFCIKHFGAQKEPEVYRMFGKDLQILEDGSWKYVSEASACIAWETNLPAKTRVEYGLGPNYGKKTAAAERHFYLHLHYLKDLKPDTTYHYRLVSIDERGNRITSNDMTFTTRRMRDAVRIPGDLQGPPYTLDKPNTTYLVTRDIVSDTTVFNIAASGIKLDLGGHTIIYDNKAGAKDPSARERGYGWYSVQGPCGIRTADRRSGMKILNGTIRQGKGRGASKPAAYNPIFLRRARDTELAGVTVEYAGSQVTGIVVNSGGDGTHVHHNVIVDRGTELYNRHRGLDGIMFNTEKASSVLKCHHNLIKRTRHRGISTSSNTEIFANEIYIDSYATNSLGVIYYNNRGAQNLKLHHNRIFGTGFHPVGLGSAQGWSRVTIDRNYVQMQAMPKDERWKGGQGGGTGGTVGPGGLHPVNGIRLQRPRNDVVHTNNTIVVKAQGEGSMMRGLWIVPDEHNAGGMVFRNNRIKCIAEDGHAMGFAVSCGGAQEADKSAILLEGNTIISNIVNVQFNDNYSHGGKYRFVGNTLVKVGGRPGYRTIRMGWNGHKYESFGHVFVDTEFESGASYDSLSFDGARGARFDFSVGWTLTIKAPSGAGVTIKDKTGAQVFSGNVPADGKLSVPLVQYARNSADREAMTPHTVTVTHAGRTKTRTVTMDAAKEIKIEL